MEVARHWRLKRQRYALMGEACPHCEAKIFPPRDVCPDCSGEAKEPFAFSGKGEVYSFTTTYDPPEEYSDYAPYTVALIKLVEGPFITAQLTDVEKHELTIGMPVEMATRLMFEDGENGPLIYGYKFRPRIGPT